MGLFDSLMDGEMRTVKKASRSMDAADRYIQSNEIDRGKAELVKARIILEGMDRKTSARPDIYRDAVARLSDAYMRSGLPVPAREVMERLVRSAPDDRSSVLLYAALYRKQGDNEGALKILDDFVSLQPNDRTAHVVRAEVFDAMNRPTESFQALLKALEADPLDESTYDLILQRTDEIPLWKGRKASAMLHKDNPEAALTELESALVLAPRNTTLMMIKVESLEKLGRNEEAQDLLEEVLDREKDNPLANMKVARQARVDGNMSNSLDHYKRALRTDPENSLGWMEVASLLNEMGRYEESLLSYDRLREVIPGNVQALYGRCTVLATMNDRPGFDAAAEELMHGIPNDPAAPLFVAEMLMKMGAEPDALEVLTKAQGSFPKDLELMDRRRTILVKQKRFPEVMVLSEEQLAVKPDHVQALRDLGESQLALGRVSEAIKTLERGLRNVPDDPALLGTLKECYKQAGKDKDVSEVCDRLLRITPNDKVALFDKAVALDRLGKKEDAVGLYGQVLSLDHNDVDASKGISVGLFSLGRFEEA